MEVDDTVVQAQQQNRIVTSDVHNLPGMFLSTQFAYNCNNFRAKHYNPPEKPSVIYMSKCTYADPIRTRGCIWEEVSSLRN
jgi:hypothetical protein